MSDHIDDSGIENLFEGTRILVVGSHARLDSFEWHVTDSLRHLGCVAQLFHSRDGASDWGSLGKAVHKIVQTFLREPERLIEARLLRVVQEFRPSIILVLLGSQLSPKTVAAIRKVAQGPIVCWCQDQMTTLGRQYLLGSGYDAVFVKDRYMQELFSRMIRSTEFHYLPEACNPRMHRPIELLPIDYETYGCDVMLAGTLYYYRQEILQQLDGIDLKIWGDRPDWLVDRLPGRYMGRDVRGDDKVRAALAAKICLNTLHYAEVNGLNCRAFEIAGCEGFQLMTHVPAVTDHFEPEVEVATYRSVDELVEKVRYFLRNPAVAREIAMRGRMRAHRDHTYERRLSDILRISLK